MSIGAFYSIPRAANVAYELGLIQIIHSDDRWILLLFSIIFFFITYLISLNPKKIIDVVGQLLTPALMIVLATLFIKAFMTFHYTEATPNEHYQSMPFRSEEHRSELQSRLDLVCRLLLEKKKIS